MFDAQTAGSATKRDLDAIIGRLADLTPSAWAAPVRCEGWDVTALAEHLVAAAHGQAEGLRRAVAGRFDVAPLATDVVPEPGPLVEALVDGRDQLAKAFAGLTSEVLDGVIPLPFGLMPAGAALQIIPIEYGFHRNDLEWALGNAEPLDADAAEALVQILPGLLPILAGGSAVSPAGVLPTEPVGFQLTAPSGALTIVFDDGAWSVGAMCERPCEIAGDDAAIALFAMGRIACGDARLTVSDVAAAGRFKTYFPGP